jgi:hypothetical protein
MHPAFGALKNHQMSSINEKVIIMALPISVSDPGPIRIQGFDDQKFNKIYS